MRKLINKVGEVTLKKRGKIYLWLCESIVSQQLSVKAADTIFSRFLGLFEGKAPTPEQILEVPIGKLRSVGLSFAKSGYLHNVARFALEQGLDHRKFSKLTDEEVIEYVTQIKGVGRWTAEIMLMFVLAREDVFAQDDVGIQNAMARLYGLNRKHKRFKTQMLAVAERWRPYRTYACIYMWRARM